MATYYNITLNADIPHGSDILNKPCTIVFTYPTVVFPKNISVQFSPGRTPTSCASVPPS